MNHEYHIASFIVLARPDALPQVCEQLRTLPGTEVHQHDGNGKIIITIEGDTTAHISQATQIIGLLDGVLACNMVFHQCDNEASPEDEAIHEN